MTLSERSHVSLMVQNNTTSFEGLMDSADQYIVAEWFRQEFNSSRLHSLHCLRHITVASDEDNRHVGSFGSDALLQFEAIDSWKCNVEDETAWYGDLGMVEECSCRSEYLWLPAFVADQKLQRFANRNIVVDNEHN